MQYTEEIPKLSSKNEIGVYPHQVMPIQLYSEREHIILYKVDGKFYIDYDTEYEDKENDRRIIPLPKGTYKIDSINFVKYLMNEMYIITQLKYLIVVNDDDKYEKLFSNIINYEEKSLSTIASAKETLDSIDKEKDIFNKLRIIEKELKENEVRINNIKKIPECFDNKENQEYVIENLNKYSDYLKNLNDILIDIKLEEKIGNKKPKEQFINRWSLSKLKEDTELQEKGYEWIATLKNKNVILYYNDDFYLFNKSENSINPKGLYMIDSVDVLEYLVSLEEIKNKEKFNKYLSKLKEKNSVEKRKTLVRFKELIDKIKEYEIEKKERDEEFNYNYYTTLVENNEFKQIEELIKSNEESKKNYLEQEISYLSKENKNRIIEQIDKYINYLNNIKELMIISYYFNFFDPEFNMNDFIARHETKKTLNQIFEKVKKMF